MNGWVLHGRCNTDIHSQHYPARSPALNMIHTQSINPPLALYQLPVTTSFPHALSALNVSAGCSHSELPQVHIIISMARDACCWAAVVWLKQRVNGHRLYIDMSFSPLKSSEVLKTIVPLKAACHKQCTLSRSGLFDKLFMQFCDSTGAKIAYFNLKLSLLFLRKEKIYLVKISDVSSRQQ